MTWGVDAQRVVGAVREVPVHFEEICRAAPQGLAPGIVLGDNLQACGLGHPLRFQFPFRCAEEAEGFLRVVAQVGVNRTAGFVADDLEPAVRGQELDAAEDHGVGFEVAVFGEDGGASAPAFAVDGRVPY